MRCNVCEVDREEGVGRRGENSAEGPRLIHLETEDKHVFPVPSFCLHPAGKSSSPQGEASSLGEVFDFELTPEDMKAIDGINRNMRYYEFLPSVTCRCFTHTLFSVAGRSAGELSFVKV